MSFIEESDTFFVFFFKTKPTKILNDTCRWLIINTSRIDSAYQSGSINQTLDDTDIDEFFKKFIIEAKQKADSPLTKHLHFIELQKLMVKESLSVSLISEVQEIVKKPIDDSYVTFQEDLTGHIKKYVYRLDLTSTNP